MAKVKVIIFSGPPCAGKTFTSEMVSDRFHLPIIRRGLFRELLFDIYGWGSWDLYKKNKDASRELMYWIIEFLLKYKQPFILDGVLRWKENGRRLCALQKIYGFDTLQFNLFADGDVLQSRFEDRVLSGVRHPGYGKYIRTVGMRRKVSRGWMPPLETRGKLLKINTTDFKKVDYKKIMNEVKAFLAE